ncbi:MAG: hypothetical protein J4452_03650 [Candidatus Aenigmarchaeota archaeon]|nr:hypothetical protein [Candidatus Aenigmarchaeota archaeon]
MTQLKFPSQEAKDSLTVTNPQLGFLITIQSKDDSNVVYGSNLVKTTGGYSREFGRNLREVLTENFFEAGHGSNGGSYVTLPHVLHIKPLAYIGNPSMPQKRDIWDAYLRSLDAFHMIHRYDGVPVVTATNAMVYACDLEPTKDVWNAELVEVETDREKPVLQRVASQARLVNAVLKEKQLDPKDLFDINLKQ